MCGGGFLLFKGFFLTWVISHLVFAVKLKNSQIIADYLSCSLQPKMSGLVWQTARAFQTISLIQLAEWSCVLTHGKAENCSAFWPPQGQESPDKALVHGNAIPLAFSLIAISKARYGDWNTFGPKLCSLSVFLMWEPQLKAVGEQSWCGAARGSPLHVMKPCYEPFWKN